MTEQDFQKMLFDSGFSLVDLKHNFHRIYTKNFYKLVWSQSQSQGIKLFARDKLIASLAISATDEEVAEFCNKIKIMT